MDLSTTYLGLSLPNPFVAGPSPLTDRLDGIKRLEDAGIAAVVLPPLFEELLQDEQMELFYSTERPAESFAEALSYFPEPERVIVDAEAYMGRVIAAKRETELPIIGTINAVTPARWVEYAVRMEQAGVDALELDFYFVATDPSRSAEDIEGQFIHVLKGVKNKIRIPVSAKLTPFHTSLAQFACRLEAAGADGLSLLHRFYEPDLDVENLEPVSRLRLSDSADLLLRLRWLAIISGNVKCSLGACGGIYSVEDTIKAIMTGADCVQLSSALMKHGTGHVMALREGLTVWLEKNGYTSVRQMRDSMNIHRIPNPEALSRAHYMHLVGSGGSEWSEQERLPVAAGMT